MRLKLNECPNCKGEAEFRETVTINTTHNNRREITYYACCPKCGIRTNDKPTRTWAMKAWNRKVFQR